MIFSLALNLKFFFFFYYYTQTHMNTQIYREVEKTLQCVSVHSISLKLPITHPDYYFNVCKICSNVTSLIPIIDDLCFLSLLFFPDQYGFGVSSILLILSKNCLWFQKEITRKNINGLIIYVMQCKKNTKKQK